MCAVCWQQASCGSLTVLSANQNRCSDSVTVGALSAGRLCLCISSRAPPATCRRRKVSERAREVGAGIVGQGGDETGQWGAAMEVGDGQIRSRKGGLIFHLPSQN